jgi:signal transduction histidine kinase
MVGAYFLPYGILLLTVVLINVTGVGSINALFFVTVIVIAGMTAGIRGVVMFGALSIVSAIGLYLAQNHGLLANKSSVSVITPAITIAHILGDSLVLIFLIRIFNQNLHSALDANQELRQLQTSLELRIAERTHDLEIAAQELKRTDLMKSQFLASMSHELRTPLNAIINFTQLIAMGVAGPVTDEQVTMLNSSLKSSKHLLQLINDVLDISKIQAGKLSLYIEEDVNLNDESKAVIDMAEPLLQKQNAALDQPIQFIQDIDQSLPLTTCDRRRIRQVLLNLLSNAIKFTEKGSITLSAKKKGEAFIFAVMDTGPGIPQEMQTRIFEPFVQATNDIKHTQGTGLGLPISRSLVQAHGGDLWLESKMGEGTTFFFSLPFQPTLKK